MILLSYVEAFYLFGMIIAVPIIKIKGFLGENKIGLQETGYYAGPKNINLINF